MKTNTPPRGPRAAKAPTDGTQTEQPRAYWTLQRREQYSKAFQKRMGVPPLEFQEHSGLCSLGHSSVKDLLRELLTKGWKRPFSKLNNSGQQIVRIESTAEGFRVVRFPTVAAARAAEKELSKSSARPFNPTALPACPFCHRADELATVEFTHERLNGTEYSGNGVRCDRCDVIGSISSWLTLGKRDAAA